MKVSNLIVWSTVIIASVFILFYVIDQIAFNQLCVCYKPNPRLTGHYFKMSYLASSHLNCSVACANRGWVWEIDLIFANMSD